MFTVLNREIDKLNEKTKDEQELKQLTEDTDIDSNFYDRLETINGEDMGIDIDDENSLEFDRNMSDADLSTMEDDADDIDDNDEVGDEDEDDSVNENADDDESVNEDADEDDFIDDDFVDDEDDI
jgi:hypothetical protein